MYWPPFVTPGVLGNPHLDGTDTVSLAGWGERNPERPIKSLRPPAGKLRKAQQSPVFHYLTSDPRSS